MARIRAAGVLGMVAAGHVLCAALAWVPARGDDSGGASARHTQGPDNLCHT